MDRQTSQKSRLQAILQQREEEKARQTAEYIRKYRPTEYQALYTGGLGPDFSDVFLKRESSSAPTSARGGPAPKATATAAGATSSKTSTSGAAGAGAGKDKAKEALRKQQEAEELKRMKEFQEQEELAKKKAMAKIIAETIVRLKQEQLMTSLQKFREDQAKKNSEVMKAEYDNYKVVQRALGYHGNGLGQGSKAIASTFHSNEAVAYNKAAHAIAHHWGAGGGGSHYNMASTKGYLKGDRIKGMTQRHSRQNDIRQGAKRKAQNSKNGAHNKSSGSMAILM